MGTACCMMARGTFVQSLLHWTMTTPAALGCLLPPRPSRQQLRHALLYRRSAFSARLFRSTVCLPSVSVLALPLIRVTAPSSFPLIRRNTPLTYQQTSEFGPACALGRTATSTSLCVYVGRILLSWGYSGGQTLGLTMTTRNCQASLQSDFTSLASSPAVQENARG